MPFIKLVLIGPIIKLSNYKFILCFKLCNLSSLEEEKTLFRATSTQQLQNVKNCQNTVPEMLNLKVNKIQLTIII